VSFDAEKYTFQEKLFALNLKLKQFETNDDERFDNDDHLFWLVRIA
jgi:hypothetical protein